MYARHLRHRSFSRARHARGLSKFLGAEVTALASTAAVQTVAPARTTNTKAEAPIHFAGNLSLADTLTIGSVTYTFKSALTEVKASGLLTFTTNPAALDTVTIDGVVYTFKDALTEAKAAGTLTSDGTNVSDGDTVTIGSKVYTFQDTLTEVDGNVKIAASNTASMTNLFHAINASGGSAGTDYATATTANTQVVATNPTGTTVVATSKVVGTASNSIATTAASTGTAHVSWADVTLHSGVNSVANEVLRDGTTAATSRTHLVEAITAGANAGTDYSTATVVHPTVTAAAASGNMSATAKTSGTDGNSLATTRSSSHIAWGGTTLSGGIDPVANEVLVGALATDTRDNLVAAINAAAGGGTTYARSTVAHDKVVAVAASNDLTLTALDVANVIPGMSVRLSKSAANLTLPTLHQLDGPLWTATTHPFTDGEGPVLLTNSGGALPTGSPAGGTDLWVHVVDTSTIALATSLEALHKGNFIRTTSAGTGTHSVTRRVDAAGFFGMLKRNSANAISKATDVDNLN